MYKEAAERIIQFENKNFPGVSFDTAVVLGSGLGGFPEKYGAPCLPYSDIDGLSSCTAPGHAGKLYFLVLNGKGILCFSGRCHFYEGNGIDKVVYPVRVMKYAGVKKLVVTNAAGGINYSFKPGDLMLILDHINKIPNPLVGKNDSELGVRFPDMTNVYDTEMCEAVKASARECGIDLKTGVYVAVTGPCYETPAEIRSFRVEGADAVGMSTVPEVIAARHCGIRVCGVSLIANFAAGMNAQPLTEQEVIDAGTNAAAAFSSLMEKALKEIVSL